jgi:hypothetical protein
MIGWDSTSHGVFNEMKKTNGAGSAFVIPSSVTTAKPIIEYSAWRGGYTKGWDENVDLKNLTKGNRLLGIGMGINW